MSDPTGLDYVAMLVDHALRHKSPGAELRVTVTVHEPGQEPEEVGVVRTHGAGTLTVEGMALTLGLVRRWTGGEWEHLENVASE